MRTLLSEEEKARADRFLRKVHGHRFTIGRGILRKLLGGYTGVDPAHIQFTYNEFGKPHLDPTHPIAFNVSHTGTHAVIAISLHASVGIDIERYREALELEKVARRYFAPSEVECLQTLPESQQEKAFYRCWSSKEAFMKVVGHGLAIGLNNFHVEVDPAKPPALLKSPQTLASVDTWDCVELPMGEGLAGVLLVEGAIRTVEFYRYTP